MMLLTVLSVKATYLKKTLVIYFVKQVTSITSVLTGQRSETLPDSKIFRKRKTHKGDQKGITWKLRGKPREHCALEAKWIEKMGRKMSLPVSKANGNAGAAAQ